MKAQYAPSYILFILGRKLELGDTHLTPSVEASQWCKLVCSVLTDWIKMSER